MTDLVDGVSVGVGVSGAGTRAGQVVVLQSEIIILINSFYLGNDNSQLEGRNILFWEKSLE